MSAAHPYQDPRFLAQQYKTDENLRIRIETHQKYGVGPELEPAVNAALALTGSEDLLDVGTGPGDFPGLLSRAGHRGRLVGIDNSPGMVSKATATYAEVEFIEANAQQLPFPNDSFDVVTARHMLYHVPDISKALEEIRRILRIGGRFLAVTNGAAYMGEYTDAINEAADAVGGEIAEAMRQCIVTSATNRFNEKTGEELLQKAFGQVHIQTIHSALVFDAAEPVIRYFDSARSMKNISSELWASARCELAKVVERKLKAGPWRVLKLVVLLSAGKSS